MTDTLPDTRRKSHRLSAAQVAKSKFSPGKHADGEGLYLVVSKVGTRHWAFIYNRAGKRTFLGLGAVKDKGLAVAREDAAAARALLARGIDPLAHSKQANAPTLSVISAQYIATFKDTVKPAVAKRWGALARLHFGDLGPMAVNKIDTSHVIAALTKVQAISKVNARNTRSYLERVLDFATVNRYRTGENPARLSGNLALAMPTFAVDSKHHSAIPYADAPALYKRLPGSNLRGAAALQMIILTAARRDEVRLMRWNEVDLDAAIWTCPGSRMKSGEEFRFSLSAPAVALLRRQRVATGGDADAFVFEGKKKSVAISGSSIANVMDDLDAGEFTIHGWRATFAGYFAEQTDVNSDLVDRCLSHVIGNAVTRAYLRSDLLDKRRFVTDAWAAYIVA